MLPLRASYVTLLMGFLCIVQGARIVRNTADIPTELFKPVGNNAGHESRRSNGGNSTGEEELDTPLHFQERFNGGVEVVTGDNDEDEEYDGETQPLYGQLSATASGGYIPGPSFRADDFRRFGNREINRSSFPSSPGFRSSNIRPLFSPAEGQPLYPNQLPLSSNNFGNQLSRTGPRTLFGASRDSENEEASRGPNGYNFHRSETYSFSSNGRGPPRIEQSVYDSRDPFGGVSMRNF